jgi:UDP-N-acetylglucosamine/UDP-N-acetylgalactosamine diphosphorylase
LQLLSGKTLFQIQAERIIRLQQLINERKGGTLLLEMSLSDLSVHVSIPWYIMLSIAVEKDSLAFFKEHAYFGLEEKQIIFFKQGEFPCVDGQGKIILDQPGRISTSPNGNGGIWRAMKEQVRCAFSIRW